MLWLGFGFLTKYQTNAKLKSRANFTFFLNQSIDAYGDHFTQ